MLKNSAKQTLKNLDSLPKMNQIEYDELVESLERIAGVKVVKNTGVKKKKTATFKQFVEKWNGKNIKNLSKSEIIENLKGYTEQGNKIANLLETGKMKIIIMDDIKFNKFLQSTGETLDEALNTSAFAIGNKSYFRSTKNIADFMSEIVHEGTHVVDNLLSNNLIKHGADKNEILSIFGNNWSFEKRAYFHERAFNIAVFDLKDKDIYTVKEFLQHIKTEYPQQL